MSSRRPSALILAANGYIGAAVTRAFVRAGYRTYGQVRRESATKDLILAEAIPIIGTLEDQSWVEKDLFPQTTKLDVIVNCVESFPDYEGRYTQLIDLVLKIADKSNAEGIKPLVLWSSGCKDYGQTLLHGDPDLAPHTEDSPINAPAKPILDRTKTSMRIFSHGDAFDGVILRPTSVYGYSNSYYGGLMDYAADQAAKGHKTLRVPGQANTVMHAAHVDDCAEAYVALAQHADRKAVAGAKYFNISAHRYETAGEVCGALAAEYGLVDGVEFVAADQLDDSFPSGLHFACAFSQWVGSESIRRLTGWRDTRPLFSEDMGVYRRAYEAEAEKGHENIVSTRQRLRELKG